ncbi:MAG: aminodeoxychorismate synthase component I [Syntrophales bacterium]|nr:aminodeoxychorismate synthase component I [Syntrophales bacterium]MDY0044571.1 aminodeoxychorismate synthase component I [Syntrophales bacterium]
MNLDNLAGRLHDIQITPFKLKSSFPEFAAGYAGLPGTIILMSGTERDCAHYHILGALPWLTLKTAGGENRLTVSDKIHRIIGSPFDVLKLLLDRFRLPAGAVPPGFPIATGLMGYLSYDLKNALEQLPDTVMNDLYLPDLYLVVPSVIIIHDTYTRQSWQCIPLCDGIEGMSSVSEVKERFESESRPAAPNPSIRGHISGYRSGLSREMYVAAVETIQKYIHCGHVYQVNLSQRFETEYTGDPFQLFQVLFTMNPAPFFAYIHAGDHHILSTSPERFIHMTGRKVEARPIKGTQPRGKNFEDDKAYRQLLLESPKEDAELTMIVDLLRNDLGKVCCSGTVKVAEHKRLETYKNVFHLVSTVEGFLHSGKDAVDLICAAFPCGSITGCPKIRAMEIIDELEPCRRHVYTGSIGYISFHDTMDLSVAIRTATIYNNRMFFSVGGGIVYDSVPACEYEETLHKGRTLMEACTIGRTTNYGSGAMVWFNGIMQNETEARVSIMDQGLLYGYGFFETIRAVNGEPGQLSAHIARFNRTWKALFHLLPPDLTWEVIIRQVLRYNHLQYTTAAVKIMATRGTREAPPYDHQLIVMAKPYVNRLTGKQMAGLRVAVFPEPRQSPLADYKTINYLYYLMAAQWARSQGADEALILNPDHTVSETNTAGLLLIQNRRVIRPFSAHVLPSVMQQTVSELLTDWGYAIDCRPTVLEDLYSANEVLLVNSLMGAVPVISLEGRSMKEPSDLCQRINSHVLV